MIEQEIIEGCIQNDPVSQRMLYNILSPNMFTICYRYAACREDAEDMLQEGFIRMFTQINTYNRSGSFEGWVRRIIVNACINHLVKHKKFNDYDDLTSADGLYAREESVYSIMQSRQVLECLRYLPIGYRTVLNLFAIEGYSHNEIAEMLNIAPPTSRSQFIRAKAILEKILVEKKIIESPSKVSSLVAAI